MASALNTGGSYTFNTWAAGNCGNGVEITNRSNPEICSCLAGYTVRPKIGNSNWGGINGTTCGASTQTMTVVFSYLSNTTLSSFTPSSGCANTTPVIITGTGFTGTTAVTFGGTAAASFTVNSPTQITATPAAGSTGTISVTSPSGTATSVASFTVNPLTTSGSVTTTICSGQSYLWPANGQTYTTAQPGVTVVSGCNTATLNLSVTPSTTNTTAISSCDSYTWSNNGQTYTTSGVYNGTTTNCVTEVLNLTINNSSTTTETVTACDTFTWSENGVTYFTTGVYTNTTTNASGCSNVATLNLTINNSSTTTETVTACDSYTWSENGVTYFTTGVYTNTTTNASGCSNVATLNLTINNSSTTTESVTACDSYTWSENGVTYFATGVYTNTTTNASGCSNVATLNLTINNSSTTTETVTACDAFTWSENGVTYFTTGVYANTTTNASGCSNVATLNLTINNSSTTTETVTACDAFTWSENGVTYFTTGVYTNTTINASGCSNVATLNLTINNSTTNNSMTVSAFGSYTWAAPNGNGQTYTTSGVYTYTTINENGCTNSAILTLSISPIVNSFTIGTSCGAMVSNLAVTVIASAVQGATAYTFRVTNVTTSASFVVTRPVNSLALGNYTTVTLATEYQIEVSTNGGTTYGPPCTLFTPRPTSTIGAQCGATLTSMTQFVYATLATSVTGYRFRVTNTATNAVEEYTPLSNVNRFSFSQLPAAFVAYGTTYSVEVALRNTNGSYLPYGATCNVTTQAFPTSEIVLAQCDALASSNTQLFNALVVSGATAYRFQLTNSSLGYSFSIDRPLSSYSLSMFPGLVAGTTYTVRVAVRIGGVWGPLTGKPCNVTTPGVVPGGERVVIANNDFVTITYPNPFTESFMFDVTTTNESAIQVRVYDMIGKQIENRSVEASEINNLQIGSNYPSGVYNVIVSQGENTQTLRVIKR